MKRQKQKKRERKRENQQSFCKYIQFHDALSAKSTKIGPETELIWIICVHIPKLIDINIWSIQIKCCMLSMKSKYRGDWTWNDYLGHFWNIFFPHTLRLRNEHYLYKRLKQSKVSKMENCWSKNREKNAWNTWKNVRKMVVGSW